MITFLLAVVFFFWLLLLHRRIIKLQEKLEESRNSFEELSLSVSNAISELRAATPKEPIKPPPMPRPVQISEAQSFENVEVLVAPPDLSLPRQQEPLQPQFDVPEQSEDLEMEFPAAKSQPLPQGISIVQKKTTTLLDLEESLGANWLLKIGMAMVVIGVALFLGYSFQRLGPSGKILIGAVTSVACIAGGWAIERRKNYIVFGRVVLSGGWALAYFTAYAMRHIEATRILDSDAAGLVAMVVVSAGMIAHSLKYRSEFVTGFAYGLAYLALMISHVHWSTLIASALLSLSIAVIVRYRNWFAVETIAIVATYLNHFVWLYPIIHPMGVSKTFFPDYTASSTLLLSYWLIFTVSHFARRAKTSLEDRHLQIGLILNALGYVGISGYQSFHPEWSFQFFVALGSVYFVLAILGKKWDRRSDFLTASSLGAFFFIIAIPYRYSGSTLSILWLATIELFLIIGYLLREIQFRRIAWCTTAPLVGYLIYEQIMPRLKILSPAGLDGGIVLLSVAICFLGNSLFFGRKYYHQIQTPGEQQSLVAYLYLGWASLIAAAWLVLAPGWLAPCWLALALVFQYSGSKLNQPHLMIQAQSTAWLGSLRFLFFDLTSTTKIIWEIQQRVVSGFTSAVLLYVYGEMARANAISKSSTGLQKWLNASATLILALLGWYTLSNSTIALAWGALSLLLFELGRSANRSHFRTQGHVMGIATFLCIVLANWHSIGSIGPFSVRILTTLPLIALFYYQFAVLRTESETEADESFWAKVYSYLGLISLLGLILFELSAARIVIGWSVVILILVAAGYVLQSPVLRIQATFLVFLVVTRCLFDNLRLPVERILSLVLVAAILFVSSIVCRIFERRKASDVKKPSIFVRHSEEFYFFAAVAVVTALLWAETRSGYLTAAWAMEGVFVFMIAVLLNRRAYRLLGLCLLMICTGKIMILDVWNLPTLQRIVTFIVLGVSLVLISFLYTKYREGWRKILLGSV